jgi:hypothetical protein
MRPALAAALAACAVAAGCGGSDGDDAAVDGARATVMRYFDALGGGNAAGACAQLTGPSREKLAEFGSDALRLKGHSCEATLGALLGSGAAKRLKALRTARITRAERHDEAVRVSVDGVDRPLEVVRAGGGWRIESDPITESDQPRSAREGSVAPVRP